MAFPSAVMSWGGYLLVTGSKIQVFWARPVSLLSQIMGFQTQAAGHMTGCHSYGLSCAHQPDPPPMHSAIHPLSHSSVYTATHLLIYRLSVRPLPRLPIQPKARAR